VAKLLETKTVDHLQEKARQYTTTTVQVLATAEKDCAAVHHKKAAQRMDAQALSAQKQKQGYEGKENLQLTFH
jgi:hypothetical protein